MSRAPVERREGRGGSRSPASAAAAHRLAIGRQRRQQARRLTPVVGAEAVEARQPLGRFEERAQRLGDGVQRRLASDRLAADGDRRPCAQDLLCEARLADARFAFQQDGGDLGALAQARQLGRTADERRLDAAQRRVGATQRQRRQPLGRANLLGEGDRRRRRRDTELVAQHLAAALPGGERRPAFGEKMVQAHDVDVVQLLQGVVVEQASVPAERGARVAGGFAARRLLRRQLAPALDEAAALLAEPIAKGRRLGQLEAVEQGPAPGGKRGRAVAARGGVAKGADVGGDTVAEAQAIADGAEGRLQALAPQARQLAAQVAARARVVELAPEQRRQTAARDLALCREHGQEGEGTPARQHPLLRAVAQERRAEKLEDKAGRHGGEA